MTTVTGRAEASAALPPGLVVLVPMLGRPQHVGPLLDSLDATTPAARVLFVVSPHDTEVHAEIDRHDRERLTVPYQPSGDYARKINAGYRHTTEPLIFCGASDLKFHPGWYEAALAKLGPEIGVVGTNDLGNPRVTSGGHSTHSIVTRWYADLGTIDEPHAILHEGYTHEFIDDELIGTAKSRKAWAMALDSHVEHLHPCWGKAPTDQSYQRMHERMARSRPLYEQRRRLWT